MTTPNTGHTPPLRITTTTGTTPNLQWKDLKFYINTYKSINIHTSICFTITILIHPDIIPEPHHSVLLSKTTHDLTKKYCRNHKELTSKVPTNKDVISLAVDTYLTINSSAPFSITESLKTGILKECTVCTATGHFNVLADVAGAGADRRA